MNDYSIINYQDKLSYQTLYMIDYGNKIYQHNNIQQKQEMTDEGIINSHNKFYYI